jgi:AraC family L-rhamnose operon regulatory protein RhaS
LERDCFTFVESGREHRFIDDPSDPLTLVIICFGPAALVANEALDQACQQFRSSFPTPQILQGRNSFRTAEIKQLFRTMLREQSLEEIGFKSLLPVQLTELMVELTRGATLPTGRSPKGVERIDGVVAYLEKNFREPVELDAMARSAGLSRRRFSQLFKERTGLSLVDYVNRQRIAFACDRLRETGHIAYSCYESGFQDMAYFYRLFKRHTSQTPGKFIGK